MERKVKNKFVCAKEVEPHVSEATIDCENEVVVGDLGAAEADQNEEQRKEKGFVAKKNDPQMRVGSRKGNLPSSKIGMVYMDALRENEDDTNNLSSGPETAYLDSSDVGSYETDSDEDVVAKKDGKDFSFFKC
ncbi:hypothetical protein V6N11_039562 [Hibiscus sabdariffa]|uniref:Uncharacterized protein n=1 Tax=Hibiscus sabdariffa TaxID=183260 RepID=A0ABR2SN51_9ROSI